MLCQTCQIYPRAQVPASLSNNLRHLLTRTFVESRPTHRLAPHPQQRTSTDTSGDRTAVYYKWSAATPTSSIQMASSPSAVGSNRLSTTFSPFETGSRKRRSAHARPTRKQAVRSLQRYPKAHDPKATYAAAVGGGTATQAAAQSIRTRLHRHTMSPSARASQPTARARFADSPPLLRHRHHALPTAAHPAVCAAASPPLPQSAAYEACRTTTTPTAKRPPPRASPSPRPA